MEKTKLLPEISLVRSWYLLWAPTGMGSTARIEEIQDVIRRYDSFARVWYPLKPESNDGKVTMVPFYGGYVFVECLWTPSMEVAVREAVLVFIEFIKDLDTTLPIPIPDEEVKMAQEFVESELKNPSRDTKFQVGANVRVLKKSLLGLVGPVISIPSPHRVMVELPWFNRPTPTLIDVSDLELL